MEKSGDMLQYFLDNPDKLEEKLERDKKKAAKSCCDSCAEGVGVCKADKIPGGLADKKKPEDFDQDQLADGVAHELEHTSDMGIATEIAMDHLTEDPHYYTKLKKIEKATSIKWKFVEKNYRPVRKIKFQGLDISIEHDKGMRRQWVDDSTGEKGSTEMKYPYGYICRTDGADGEQVDVYVGPNTNSEDVFIIHQMKAPNFKAYDEDKVMVGFDSLREAKAAYLMHYNSPKFLGTATTTTIDDFKRMFVKKSLSAAIQSATTKRWVRKGTSHCKTGVCDRLHGQEIPGDAQFIAMKGMKIDGPPAHTNCNCELEYSFGKSMNTNTYSDYHNINAMLSQLSMMPDEQVLQMAGELWGEGYVYKNPARARTELLGYLMDQRDLLGVQSATEKQNLEPSPSLPVKEQSGSSEYFGSSPNSVREAAAPAHAVSSSAEALNLTSSNDLPQADSSKRPKSA